AQDVVFEEVERLQVVLRAACFLGERDVVRVGLSGRQDIGAGELHHHDGDVKLVANCKSVDFVGVAAELRRVSRFGETLKQGQLHRACLAQSNPNGDESGLNPAKYRTGQN